MGDAGLEPATPSVSSFWQEHATLTGSPFPWPGFGQTPGFAKIDNAARKTAGFHSTRRPKVVPVVPGCLLTSGKSWTSSGVVNPCCQGSFRTLESSVNGLPSEGPDR